jgi:hypothetical protein
MDDADRFAAVSPLTCRRRPYRPAGRDPHRLEDDVNARDDGRYPDDPPPYGPPAYGPPPYGPPSYGPSGYAPGWRPTNTMAILALVFIFVFAPAALVFGLVARSQIRRTGEGGDGMALAGIIVGGIAVTVTVVVIVLWFIALASISNGVAP